VRELVGTLSWEEETSLEKRGETAEGEDQLVERKIHLKGRVRTQYNPANGRGKPGNSNQKKTPSEEKGHYERTSN